MSYNIPYDSDYANWYGTPQNVTRLSATLTQTIDEEGNFIGHIVASWDVPDNGGTFVLLVSTDGTNYYVAKNNIKGNTVETNIAPDTGCYIKVITVLSGQQSTGTIIQLSVSAIPTPNTPTVTVVSGGLKIDSGIIPSQYTVNIAVNDVVAANTSERVYSYMCNGGTYVVKIAYVDQQGSIGSYSNTVTKVVSETASEEYTDDAIAEFAEGTEIEANSDLDNFTIAGQYYCKNSMIAATLTNCPISDAFAMIVLNYDTSVIQLIFADNGKMYQRFALGSWYVHDGVLVTQGGV